MRARACFLAGRTQAKLEAVAEEIRATGGAAETAEVDALDEAAVDAHADAIDGGIDISFNVIDLNDVQGTPLAEMAVDDFWRPIDTAVRSYFLTARAAARHMIRRGGGVILTFGGSGDPIRATRSAASRSRSTPSRRCATSSPPS